MLLIFILLIVAPAHADVGFTDEESAVIVVTLEDNEARKVIIESLKEENLELNKKIENLIEINKLQTIRISQLEQTVNSLERTIEVQAEAYEKKIKDQKPSLFDKLGWGASGSVIGFLACAILLL